ncbi:PLP-dependent aminotransferase family protein [Sharpea azabuensis]|uniref:PLP-dependent aminotransferase family protein n=1 Tax=Sharpea porci TaxID=2652286 RepID=A0A844FWY2_9FIRM|nr:PLP-dependent aminotransferase family protein [Sharpea porci]MST89882.1 PLP-dependent aminotransferase family protein [Sharpea porci]
MKIEISRKMQNVQASAIREILKMTSNPDIISFAGGNPASDAFPVEDLKRISAELFEEDPIGLLQYGITEGDAGFLEAANKFFNREEQVTRAVDQIIATTGSQQIMDLLTKVLCNEGDVVACEEPAFLGALNSFKEDGAVLRGVGFTKEGELDLAQLETTLSIQPRPKFFYTIPNFQNPMGTTMSLETRKQVLALCKKYGVLILEDNPYGAIRFTNEHVPSIKSLDEDDMVIYAASLSKILAPGLRLAVCIGREDIVGKMVVAKQGADVHTNLWAQKVAARFLSTCDMNAHLSRIQAIYKKKCELMLKTMDETFDQRVTYTRPDGGMFIWVNLPEGSDVLKFAKEAIENNVAIVPGISFYTSEDKPCYALRLNFSTPTDEKIVKGIQILGQMTHQL